MTPHSDPDWRLLHPVPPDWEARAGAYSARRRATLKHAVGAADLREAMLATPLRRDRICVAVRGGEVVGCLSYRMDGRGAHAPSPARFRARFGPVAGSLRYLATEATLRRGRSRDLYVEGFAVSPAMRGHGIGTALLEWLGSEVVRHGKQGWRAEVVAGRQAPIRAYERAGAVALRTIALGPAGALVGASRMVLYRRAVAG
ncbi:MAG: GNAT family N-acetyltransferase [Pseudomonadota bacterium]